MVARLARNGTVQISVAVTGGVLLGLWQPAWAVAMKPLSDLFLSTLGSLIPLVMFTLIVSAIARLDRGAGVLATRMVLYFQLMSLLSLVVGLLVGWLILPGASVDLDLVPGGWDGAEQADTLLSAPVAPLSSVSNTLPGMLVGAFTHGIMLPLLSLAVVLGLTWRYLGDWGLPWLVGLERAAALLLRLLRLFVRLAPIAAFGAMAYTVAHYGGASLWPLLKFLLAVYLASLVFVFGVLGLVARLSGFPLLRLVLWLRRELLLVVVTGSSVAALPALIGRLEQAGCPPGLVRLSLTTGYTFNLAGSNLYIAVALLFLTQFVGVELSIAQLAVFVVVGLITTLGSTSVAGSAFLTLAATLAILQLIPLEGAGMLLGVERLMKCRSITNVLGNCVACLALARWQGTLDDQRLGAALAS
jgi:aerobic C4-dicarboxylate transport protein